MTTMTKPDFSGYATKTNLKCSDGRTILKDAFKDCHGLKVPLVWNHGHSDPTNILGHALLENRDDGVYAYCYLNDSAAGRHAKEVVIHKDVNSLSIYANQLVEKAQQVIHGMIREVSVVLLGANPGAKIDNIFIQHADGSETLSDEDALIMSGVTFDLEIDNKLEHKDEQNMATNNGEETVQDVFDTLTEKQKNVVYAIIAEAVQGADENDNVTHAGDQYMKTNIFDGSANSTEQLTLSHSDFLAIVNDAQKNYNGSFAQSFLAHTGEYGIENIDFLFPDARTLTETPTYIKRQTEWVAGVLNDTRHSPFSRIKTVHADITANAARAKGYVKGNLKNEEIFRLLKRVTTPTTIYKKQKLDRDDIVDITDLDVVTFTKMEMRLMLDEEVARAILVGDGRAIDDPDKIDEEHIRCIYTDDDMYSHKVVLEAYSETYGAEEIIDSMIENRQFYKGSGSPSLYITSAFLAEMLLIKDTLGRRIYSTMAELQAVLRVKSIVEVPVMEDVYRITDVPTPGTRLDLVAILVDLSDYTVGADKGGQISMFDDFDIDYNQQKFLLETRISGALTLPKSALVFEQVHG